jgi:hypothetical protein
MANLIAGKRVVPELIQSDFTAENIVQQIERLLPDGPPRQSMMEELARIRGLLSAGYSSQDRLGMGWRTAAPSTGWRRLRWSLGPPSTWNPNLPTGRKPFSPRNKAAALRR